MCYWMVLAKKLPMDIRLKRQLAIPRKLRLEIMKECHDTNVGGAHQGFDRTIQLFRQDTIGSRCMLIFRNTSKLVNNVSLQNNQLINILLHCIHYHQYLHLKEGTWIY